MDLVGQLQRAGRGSEVLTMVRRFIQRFHEDVGMMPNTGHDPRRTNPPSVQTHYVQTGKWDGNVVAVVGLGSRTLRCEGT